MSITRPREQILRLSDFATRVVSQGDGANVLLIGGAGATAASWQGVSLLLRRSLTVWTYDQRGVGAAFNAPGAVDVAALATDAVRLIDTLGLARVHLVGHSTGARTAIAVAHARPGRVRSITGLCAWGWADGLLEHRFALVRDLLCHLPFDSARKAIGFFLASRPWQADEERFARLLSSLGRDGDDPAWQGLVRHLLAPTDGDPERGALPAVPTLLLGARADRMIPPEYACELADSWPGAHFALVGADTAGHLVHVEEPAPMARAIADFLSSLDA